MRKCFPKILKIPDDLAIAEMVGLNIFGALSNNRYAYSVQTLHIPANKLAFVYPTVNACFLTI